MPTALSLTSPETLPTSSKEIRQNIAIFEAGGQLPTGGKVRKPKECPIVYHSHRALHDPGNTRSALEVFCLYEADGEYFDISDPAHIVRDSFTIGREAQEAPGYYVGEGCIGCI